MAEGEQSKTGAFLSSIMGGASGTSAVGGIAQGLGSAMGGPVSSGPVSARTPVSIAPIGVNFGEIIQPMNQSSPETGGYGIQFPSRYQTTGYSPASLGLSMPEGASPFLLIGLALALGLGAFFFIKR